MLDDDLPAEAQDGSSAIPLDADGMPVGGPPEDTDVPDDGPDSIPDDDVEMQDDGSALVSLGEDDDHSNNNAGDFYANLADGVIDASVLQKRADELLELIERDIEARKERDKQQAEGIQRTGLGGDAPGGAQFEGASRAVHPVLAEQCIDFSAKAMKEIFPPDGPCKTKIIGKSTPEKVDKAERKRKYMNWQMTTKIVETRTQTKKMLTQLPLGGSQYKNWWYDHELKRPRNEFVPIDHVILPSESQDFYSCQRITHRQDITEQKFLSRVDSGMYVDVDIAHPLDPELTSSAKATEKVAGVSLDPYNQDGLRTIYVVNSECEAFDDDKESGGDPTPYIWHIDATTRKVLGLYRNWEEDDETRERMHFLIDYTFIHWRGPQGVGLLHLIGSLSGAITGGLRSILDKALAENSMSGVKLKGGKVSGTSEQPSVGETAELEGPTAGTVDDIRKLYMPYPFPPSTPVLFNTIQWMVDQARGVVSVASDKLADGKNDMPVGSVLALIEQGSGVFSDIHSGLHHSQAQELKVLHRFNKWHLSDKETVEELGDLVVMREDFEGPCDIIPVSDPHIFSETQRYAQMQAVHQLAENPVFMPKANPDGILKRTLNLLHIDNPEELFKFQPEAEDLDPISENMVTALGEQPIKAFQQQDHMAHLKVHLHYLTSPMYGANPLLGPKVLPPLMAHVVEHMTYLYVEHSVAAARAGSLMKMDSKSTDDRFAVTMHLVDYALSNDFQQLGPMFQQAMQLFQQAQQQAQQPPLDPASQVQMKVGMAEVQRKAQADQMNNKTEMTRIQSNHMLETQKQQSQAQLDQGRFQSQNQLDAMIQAQKDAREKEAENARNQREQERLQAENVRADKKLYNDQVLESIKQGHETHRQHLQNITDTIAQHLAPLSQIPEKMAEGGRAQAAQPIVVQQDPEHTQALTKLGEALQRMPDIQNGQMSEHVERQRSAITELIGMIVEGQNRQAQELSHGLQAMGAQIAQGMQANGSIIAQGNEQILRALEDMGDQAQEMHAAHGGSVDALKSAIATLQANATQPRIRTLGKDKFGKKFAIDRIAKPEELT